MLKYLREDKGTQRQQNRRISAYICLCEEENYAMKILLTCFESNVSEVAFPRQPAWKFHGNRRFEAYIRDNAQATETGIFRNSYSLSGPSGAQESHNSSYNEILD
jgi:hypothetical protein